MILRRVTQHVNDQNWFAVALDFLIVVVGVLLAIQVANWNERRQDQSAYEDSVTRLIEELRINDRHIKRAKDNYVDELRTVNAAANSLKTCQTGPEVRQAINDGLNQIQAVISIEPRFEAIDALTTDPRLIAQQSEEMRQLFNDINRRSKRMDWHTSSAEAAMKTVVLKGHALISYAPLDLPDMDSITTREDYKSYYRIQELDVPLAEACKDPTLLRLFAEWESGTTYVILQINAHREHLADWLKTLGHPLGHAR